MFGSLARFALVFAGLAFVIPDTLAHDSWISRGDHRNAAGEWCCGEGDCFVVPKERVMMTGDGYVIIHGPLAGIGPSMYEAVPFSEAQPSPDGEFWRCKRPDGSRRCFFAPPPSTWGALATCRPRLRFCEGTRGARVAGGKRRPFLFSAHWEEDTGAERRSRRLGSPARRSWLGAFEELTLSVRCSPFMSSRAERSGQRDRGAETEA